MPELPEVEVFVRRLQSVVGRRIDHVDVLDDRLNLDGAPLQGATITAVARRGKHILIHLGSRGDLIVHLRMSGRLRLLRSQNEAKHTRLILQAFWQGRYVNCTSCGARLERSLSGMVLSAVAGILAWIPAMWLLSRSGVAMEVEISLGLAALIAAYFGVHILTLRLKPREEDPTLKLRGK